MRRQGLVNRRAPTAYSGGISDSYIQALPSLLARIDMLAPGTFTVDGGTVISLTNRKSNAAWDTSLTAFPAYEEFGFGGKPCLKGGAAAIVSTEAPVVAALTGEDNPVTVIAVVEPDAVEATQTIFGAGNSAVSNSRTWRFGKLSAQRWYVDKVDDAAGTSSIIGVSGMATGRRVVSWVIRGNTGFNYPGNGAPSPANGSGAFNGGTTTPDRVAVLARPDSGPDTFWGGRLAELIVCGEALGADLVSNIMRFASWKWGV